MLSHRHCSWTCSSLRLGCACYKSSVPLAGDPNHICPCGRYAVYWLTYISCLKKYVPLLFLWWLLQTWTNFHNFFTVKFRKDLHKKNELKLPSPSNLLPHYIVTEGSTIQLYIHISNRLCHPTSVSRAFIYLFFLPNTDVIMTLLQYFVHCITHSFQLWR